MPVTKEEDKFIRTDDDVREEAAISKVLSGDTAAYRVLVERHSERMIRLAYTFVGNFEDARDIAQQAFLRAYESLRRFRRGAKFSTWLYRIVVNLCKDFYKKNRNVYVDYYEVFDILKDDKADPIHPIDLIALKKVLNEAINQLSIKQRMVITLSYFEDFSIDQTAQMMSVSKGTVKATKHQALKRLKKALESQERRI